MSVALLVVGYLLAVPPLFRLWRVWRQRIWWAYAVETLGAAMITAGWLMRGNTGGAIVNGSWTVLWGLAFPVWVFVSRSRNAGPAG